MRTLKLYLHYLDVFNIGVLEIKRLTAGQTDVDDNTHET